MSGLAGVTAVMAVEEAVAQAVIPGLGEMAQVELMALGVAVLLAQVAEVAGEVSVSVDLLLILIYVTQVLAVAEVLEF